MRIASSTRFVRVLFTACLAVALGFALDMAMSKEPGEPVEAPAARTSPEPDGRELFVREWIPGDPRSHRGDGLGPVFNDSSCVACPASFVPPNAASRTRPRPNNSSYDYRQFNLGKDAENQNHAIDITTV